MTTPMSTYVPPGGPGRQGEARVPVNVSHFGFSDREFAQFRKMFDSRVKGKVKSKIYSEDHRVAVAFDKIVSEHGLIPPFFYNSLYFLSDPSDPSWPHSSQKLTGLFSPTPTYSANFDFSCSSSCTSETPSLFDLVMTSTEGEKLSMETDTEPQGMKRSGPSLEEGAVFKTPRTVNSDLATYPFADASASTSTSVNVTNSTDVDGFSPPSLRHTAAKIIPKVTKTINTKSKFAPLKEKVLEDPNVPELPLDIAPKTPRIKPIHLLKEQDYKQTIKFIAENVVKDFSYTVTKQFIRIFPKSVEAHKRIADYVKSENIQGYILPIGVAKPIRVVIRGLDINTQTDYIQQELTALGYPVLKVNQLISKKKGEEHPMPLFQIHLSNCPEGKEIFNLTAIEYLRVRVEEFRQPRKVLQCYNCQFFHHHQSSCLMKPRCVRCNQAHKSFECPLLEGRTGKVKIDNPICCNCGGAHSASFRGCPHYPKLKIPQNNLQNSTQPFYVDPKITFAQRLAGNSQTPPPLATPFPSTSNPSSSNHTIPVCPELPSNNIMEAANLIHEIEQELQTDNLANFILKLRHILANIKDAPTWEDKMYVLMRQLRSLLQVD